MVSSGVSPVVHAADDVPGPVQGAWTYDAYTVIPDDGKRYEIVDGVLYGSPSPRKIHQRAVFRCARVLASYVEEAGLGEVFVAPYDVRMGQSTVVQPDVLVVLAGNASRAGDEYVDGPPDLVVEVVSPGTAIYDRERKRHAYERAGVPEYWIADPYSRSIEVQVLDGVEYRSLGVYAESAVIPSRVLPGLRVETGKLWE